MKLLPHQEKYASGYKDKAFWVHEGGTGKTICGAVWLRDGRDTDALVICPKRVVKKWGDTLKKWGTCSTVISKDQFKKGIKDGSLLKRWSAIIVDEADEFASPLFTKDRSQLSTALYTLVKTYDMPIALLTATPIRSSPWNLHSLLCYLGDYTDYKAWRKEFFYLQYPDEYQYKFLDRPAYFPNEEWRTQIRAVLEQKADIVLLRDCVDNLPPTEDIIIEMPQRKYEGDRELNPTKRFVLEHQFEQELKPKEILAIGKEYRKVLVVAYYVEQIEEFNRQLSKNRQTFMVHGSTKDQEEMLAKANEVDECFLIVQASLGAGFDADTFSAVVFASMSYAVRDLAQMRFRVRRIHNLHKVKYYYLIGGRCDEAVKACVDLGKQFTPSEWISQTSPEQ